MAEFRFYHLERRRLDQALPDILEDALGHKLRAVVQAPSSERVEALNEQLWTFSDESFLPHGAARDRPAAASLSARNASRTARNHERTVSSESASRSLEARTAAPAAASTARSTSASSRRRRCSSA